MHTLLVNGGHVVLALIGIWLVYYAERAKLTPRVYWGLIGGFSAIAAFLLFLVTFPVWIFRLPHWILSRWPNCLARAG